MPNCVGLSTSHNKIVASEFDFSKFSLNSKIFFFNILSPRKTINFSLLTKS